MDAVPRPVIIAPEASRCREEKMSVVTNRTTAIDGLDRTLEGELVRPGTEAYETHRQVWNGMIDKHPGLIARCVSVADVITTVNLARDEGILLAVRGGGHSFAGFSTCDDGLVLDLSPMNAVEADPGRRTGRGGGGA